MEDANAYILVHRAMVRHQGKDWITNQDKVTVVGEEKPLMNVSAVIEYIMKTFPEVEKTYDYGYDMFFYRSDRRVSLLRH